MRVSRRRFCAAAGAGLVLAGLPACEPGGGERLGEGALDDVGGGGGKGSGGGKDGGGGGGGGGPADMTAPSDLAHGSCTAGTIDAGAASGYSAGGTPKYFKSGKYELFVVRDGGGLYAVTALCSHSGCTNEVQGSQYYCPCHGATFAWDGSKPTLPAITPLKHYAICVDGAGNVTVDPKTTVPASTRY